MTAPLLTGKVGSVITACAPSRRCDTLSLCDGAHGVTRPTFVTRHRGGYLLVECLVYIAVLAVVMGVAFSAFYRCLSSWRDLARNTDDIARVLKAGEIWRADIRAAAGPLQPVEGPDFSALEIP